MMTIELAKKEFWKNAVEGYVIILSENFESDVDFSVVEKKYPHVKSLLKSHQFKGKVGQSFALTSPEKGDKLVQYIFIGTGKYDGVWYKELEDLRRAVGAAVLKLKKLRVDTAVLQVPENKKFGVEPDELIKQISIAASMADYEFSNFKTKQDEKRWAGTLFLATCAKKAQVALDEAAVISKAVNDARMLCDMPPNIATPTYVSEQAKKLSADVMGLKCAVFDRDKAEELGMGGFLSVDVGSEQEGKFVVLEYDSEEKDAPTVALVGKGVTFDSGGISLKPANYMTGMKFDMSGAAAVIGAMQIIAQLKPKVHVVGLTPLVENMPSGRANKQDDIITFMNGKTAEIVNTDAEGRLILADALCYAEKFYKPDIIIDIATLTGSCLHALGHSFTAIMTKDEKMSELLRTSAEITGDRVWPMPLDDDFKAALKSEVADMSNCGKAAYKAGTITAAHFLSNFVEKAKWAHLDIAGTADGVPDVNYLGKGATGAGVRLLAEFIITRVK
jgi:leucyl aminopeptidase